LSSRLKDNLVGYWPLNNHASDESGHGNDGTWGAGDEGYADGPFGRSVADFDGAANLSLGTAVNSILSGGPGISMSLWSASDVVADPDTLFGFQVNGASTGFQIRWSGVATLLVGGRSNASDAFQSDVYIFAAPPVGLPLHIVGILDFPSDTILIYINGALVSTSAVTFGSNMYVAGVPTNTAQFGSDPSGTASFLDGRIWNARLYNIALTGDEIMTLFRKGHFE